MAGTTVWTCLALLFRQPLTQGNVAALDTAHCREIDKCKWLARVAVPMDIDAAAEEAATLPERRNGSARPMKRYPHTSLHESVDAIPAHNAVLGPRLQAACQRCWRCMAHQTR